MPLRNRVTPFGDLVAVPDRGALMGNRGVLHDDERRIVRFSQGRRWIACLTDVKGRRRPLMTPGRYTELFFLDEATALAAGHRPCWECRRADALRFRDAWARAAGADPATARPARAGAAGWRSSPRARSSRRSPPATGPEPRGGRRLRGLVLGGRR